MEFPLWGQGEVEKQPGTNKARLTGESPSGVTVHFQERLVGLPIVLSSSLAPLKPFPVGNQMQWPAEQSS